MSSPTALVGYIALFACVGLLFVLVNLLVGRLVRPANPVGEKLEIYECGEPTIGSSFVQFDLRFYVVALVFIVFDVEVAFLFPLATVFGKATSLVDPAVPLVESVGGQTALSRSAVEVFRELGFAGAETLDAVGGSEVAQAAVREAANQLAWLSFAAINVFFAVLLVGFAYEWKTGAFDWVRAITKDSRGRLGMGAGATPTQDETRLTVSV
jgi:NADH-quinone oxidoreductase subunit A